MIVSYESHLALGRELATRLWERSARGYLLLWAVNNGLFGRATGYGSASYVVSSDYQRRELLALGAPRDRLSVIPSVVDTGKLLLCGKDLARRRFGIPPTRPVVGYAGHFNFGKGADTVAEAFALLARQDPSLELALAWSGQGDPAPIRQALSGLDGRVTWLGKVHMGAFLSAIDVLALPYRSTAGQSAFPALLIEALHAGCPLVTSDLPLVLEVVAPDRTGLVCEPDRPRQLAGQLGRLLESNERRIAMSAAQMIEARERFDPMQLALRFEALYYALTSHDQGKAAA